RARDRSERSQQENDEDRPHRVISQAASERTPSRTAAPTSACAAGERSANLRAKFGQKNSAAAPTTNASATGAHVGACSTAACHGSNGHDGRTPAGVCSGSAWAPTGAGRF